MQATAFHLKYNLCRCFIYYCSLEHEMYAKIKQTTKLSLNSFTNQISLHSFPEWTHQTFSWNQNKSPRAAGRPAGRKGTRQWSNSSGLQTNVRNVFWPLGELITDSRMTWPIGLQLATLRSIKWPTDVKLPAKHLRTYRKSYGENHFHFHFHFVAVLSILTNRC